MSRDGWNGFNVLHLAAARVGGLDLGFVPGQGGRDVAGILAGCEKGEIDAVYLLGADEIDTARLGTAFVIYQGHHGDRGAQRADVVLPGAAYTEKDATYVNTEGRVQLAGAPCSRPARRARIGRSCARCRPLSASRCPMIRSPRCAAGWCRRIRASPRIDEAPQAAWGTFGKAGAVDDAAFVYPVARFLSHRPDQPRLADHGGMRRRARRRRRGEDRHAWVISCTAYGLPTAILVAEILAIIVPLLLAVAYLTYAERKVLAAAQLRRGPNVVGPFGLLQPIADGLKLLIKETVIPSGANRVVFVAAPMVTFTLSLVAWAVIPFDNGMVIANINVGILYLFAISSLGVYGIIMAGWASNSKYAFLGALRSAAQMVSYEVSIGFVMVTVLLCVGSLNLSTIVEAQQKIWFCVPLLPMFVVFFISGLAETNRSPFDLPEGESELVAGFFVEYSAMAFALFFLGEYANMILMSAMTSILFLGGWLPPFGWRRSPGRWASVVDLLVLRARSPSCCSASSGCARPSRASATTSSCGWAGRCFCRCRCSGSCSRRACW